MTNSLWMDEKRKTVLFLCTGNSYHSQIAEAIVNARLRNQWWAFSAGTEPTGDVHPLAIRALDEINIRHKGKSKNASEFQDLAFDLVIIVCDDAEKSCPT